MTVVIIAIVAVLLVLLVGFVIFVVMRRSQSVVPDVADGKPAGERVVGLDEHGRSVTEVQEPRGPARDGAAFESLLQDEIHDLGMRQPQADDEN